MSTFDDSPSLERLITSASDGDEDSILELYESYNGVVCRIALHHLRLKGCHARADHSEDIIGSAWLAILTNLGQVKCSEKFESWMNIIILNLVIHHVRGNEGCISNQQKRDPLEAAEEADIERGEKVWQDAVLANEIRTRAYARSSEFGEVLRLYIEEDYTMEEVARQLGESPARLRSMYYRNMDDLRELFKDDDDNGNKGNDDDDKGHDDEPFEN